jgi:hypothetical protein
MNNKKLKNYILKSSCDINYLQTLLSNSFSPTVEVIFNSLYILLKDSNKNKEKIECLIELLNNNIENFSEKKLKTITNLIRQLNNNINNNFSAKQKIGINNYHYEINEMFNNINNKLIKINKERGINKVPICLEYLIFQEKNLTEIKKFILKHPNLLKNKNKDGDNVLSTLIKIYISLDEHQLDQIEYYKEIIMFFINGKFYEEIIEDKEQYLNIINQANCDKKHVVLLKEKFKNSNLISLLELEDMYNLSFIFPHNVLTEINSLKKDNNQRYDFTNQECITIDGENARCLDDALYLEKNEDGSFNLYIHIVDIPSFIPYNSLINKEAMKREESLYLRDRILTMYPEYISYNTCSLLDNTSRNVISLIIKVDSNYEIIEDEIKLVKGEINVHHRLSYNMADNIILNADNSLSNMLKDLLRISLKRRESNNSKDLYRKYENIFSTNKSHQSINIDTSLSANIIQEMMVLYNYLVAKMFMEKSLPFIYRKVSFIDEEIVKKQLDLLKKYHSEILLNEEIKEYFKNNLIRSSYVNVPIYHQGLDLKCYSHCSSPDRRYPDSLCQYLMYDFLFNKNINDDLFTNWKDIIDNIVPYLNTRKEENELFSKQYNYLSRNKLLQLSPKNK